MSSDATRGPLMMGGEAELRRSSVSSQESQPSHDATLEQEPIIQSSSLFTRPPLEDRSKYEKLHNAQDEESEEECPLDPLHRTREPQQLQLPDREPLSINRQRRHHYRVKKDRKKADESTVGGRTAAKDGVFICSVSDDDSIGSASDLKARINDEYDYDNCDRGDVSETISSSVYHAECESVTTHEEDPRTTGEIGDPAQIMHRGPKPSRAAIRARARAIQEQENRRCTQDRLLGHEYGEKPLLLDDELDSGEEENSTKLTDEEESPGQDQQCDQPQVRPNIFHVPRPFRKSSSDESHKQSGIVGEEDVFALAPFKSSLKKLNKKVFQSRSQPSSNTVSPLESSSQPIVTPPMANSSPAPGTLGSPEVADQTGVEQQVRLPVQADIIYEESPNEDYPIYENVLLNRHGSGVSVENGATSPRYYPHYENVPVPYSVDSSSIINPVPNKNPFVNPFVNESPVGMGSQEIAVHVPAHSRTVADQKPPNPLRKAPSQQSGHGVMSQSLDSLTPNSTLRTISSPSSSQSTDLFGSTPFNDVTASTNPSNDTKEFSPLGHAILNGVSQLSSSSQQQYFPQPSESSSHLPTLSSTPRAIKVPYPASQGSAEARSADFDDDADLFGAVPFKPILGHQLHYRGDHSIGSLRSQTLPANMSSTFHSQMAQMDDGMAEAMKFFSTPKPGKKSTPPSFRKPRMVHQKLSDSDTSTDDEAVKGSRKINRHRDRSKDRLKYKNISEEFEEENTMVLPMKQFGHLKKEKVSKKTKKLEKAEKKSDKPEKKPEKNMSFESVGISNMSFEDFTLEEHRREAEGKSSRESDKTRLDNENASEDFLQSPEEDDSDLRTTGGTRFGSLKRGINPFSKLGR
ncbi:hypothetical protein Pcinc_027119 [Petrolisthes cinctipes]|uniref:Uncharacterized protein n=1 Tax=Petrolisthes cinctipes TaxID=88211 RepID=A0AAE1F645_PETCI|nr:hypothetical protein Pcinc_027119 [Petrolisthes cinctipes]